MSGLVAIVTGGARGLGWSIGQRLLADGYTVVAADLDAGETPGSKIEWVELDIRDPDAVESTFRGIAERFGRFDALVNNAGIQLHRPIEDLEWSEWASVVDVNLHGTFACLQAGGRIMLEVGHGAMVNIASIGARGQAGRAPYATTKAAIVGLTATAGAEWAARGVRVNAVAPGYIDTGVFRQGVEAGRLDLATILNRIPQGRLAQADEIAGVVAFLLSDAAGYIAGQTLYVDGGFVVDYGVPLIAPTA
jgi:3-oxoacyl-[acyl-carrier protein] reductase